MKDRATTAEAEAERLRAALKWIAGHQLGAANGQPDNRLDPLSGASCVRRARTALEGKTDGK